MGNSRKNKKRKTNSTRTSNHRNNNNTTKRRAGLNSEKSNRSNRVQTNKRTSSKGNKSATLLNRKKRREKIKKMEPIKKGTDLRDVKKKKNKKRNKIIIRIVLVLMLLIILAGLIAGGVFMGILFSDKFAMTAEDLSINNSNTIIYDAEGNVILELSGKENRKIISIDDMNKYLPDAFVAIEDERFYKHKGVDIKRTAAATLTYVTHSGSSNFGGSTITQQLVKNITNEKESTGKEGIQRKMKEMSRAYQIEKMIDKKQILELYLNLIPLGSSGGDICGVEMASIYYFNKSAKDLTIEECAFIAGVTHSPTQYNPFKENPNIEKITNRTKTVLIKMKELGFINDEQYDLAITNTNNGLNFVKGELPNSSIKSYFIEAAVDQVINDLIEQKGMSKEYAESRVYNGGLKIYTTMNPTIQQIVETEYKSDTFIRPSRETEGQHTQSAMVIIEQSSGKVVGCMGGLGTDVDAIGINRIESLRQPGSSIKPIGVYGAALEKGIITASTVYDNTYPTVFGTSYTPHNASNQKTGLCTVRDALEVSSNIVACKVMSELTPDSAIDFMRELGITSLIKGNEGPTNDANLATALGGVTYGISPLQMSAAYATIANGGVYIQPTFYTQVKDSEGNVVVSCTQETRRVFSEGNAYVMQNLLKQPVEGSQGTAGRCKMSNVDVGAKTGTTQEQKDVWLCGFTPYYTAATWFGYDRPEELNTAGGSPATLIWANVMKNINGGLPEKRFVQPTNVVTARVCRVSGKCATAACSNTYVDYFVEGAVPGQCEGHNKFTICSESKKLATEYCKKTEITYGTAMPEKEANASGKWKTNSGNKYSVITEKCNKHTAENSNKNDNDKNNNNNGDKTVVTNSDVKVPNVIGKSENEARAALGSLKVTVNYVTTTDSGKNNIVNAQSIPQGTVVSKEAQITITVYRYSPPTNNSSGSGNGNNSGNNGGNNGGNNAGGNGTTGSGNTNSGSNQKPANNNGGSNNDNKQPPSTNSTIGNTNN